MTRAGGSEQLQPQSSDVPDSSKTVFAFPHESHTQFFVKLIIFRRAQQ